jgi:hypothetical protein
MSNEQAPGQVRAGGHQDGTGHGHGPKERQYEFSVDGVDYVSDQSALTGAQIKALIPNFDSSYQLVLEARGNDPDQVIADESTANLNVHPRPAFYTVPPATFGQ